MTVLCSVSDSVVELYVLCASGNTKNRSHPAEKRLSVSDVISGECSEQLKGGGHLLVTSSNSVTIQNSAIQIQSVWQVVKTRSRELSLLAGNRLHNPKCAARRPFLRPDGDQTADFSPTTAAAPSPH